MQGAEVVSLKVLGRDLCDRVGLTFTTLQLTCVPRVDVILLNLVGEEFGMSCHFLPSCWILRGCQENQTRILVEVDQLHILLLV